MMKQDTKSDISKENQTVVFNIRTLHQLHTYRIIDACQQKLKAPGKLFFIEIKHMGPFNQLDKLLYDTAITRTKSW